MGILDDRFCGVGYAGSWMDEGLESKKSEIGGEGCRDFHEKVSITPSSSSVLVTHEGSKEVFCSTEGRVEHLFLSADARGSVCPLHVRPHILDEAIF